MARRLLSAFDMKTSLLAIAAIATLASPALAGKHRPSPAKTKTAPTKKGLAAATPVIVERESDLVKVEETKVDFNFGEDFVMQHASASRESARPDVDEETFEAKGISTKESSLIVKANADQLEYCWLKLPAAKRADTSATLHLAIEASGAVAGAWIDGSVPASVEKCMVERAEKWSFPAADAGGEVEHAFSFSTLEAKGK